MAACLRAPAGLHAYHATIRAISLVAADLATIILPMILVSAPYAPTLPDKYIGPRGRAFRGFR